MGIAEQDMICTAAGLALSGKIPYACTFGIFASGRAWDQVRVSVAYMEANVKIIGTHGGVTVGEDGATHQALDEIALMRILPNMTVIVPCDAHEAYRATIESCGYSGPVYIRLGRNPAPVLTSDATPFKIGKAATYREGEDVTIIACGHSLYEAEKAHDELKKDKIKARVINLHTIKPLDTRTILNAAKETGAIVTVEEHSIYGGMGSAVAEFLSQNLPVPMKMLGINDKFGESGTPMELLKYFGLLTEDIVRSAKSVIKAKKKK